MKRKERAPVHQQGFTTEHIVVAHAATTQMQVEDTAIESSTKVKTSGVVVIMK